MRSLGCESCFVSSSFATELWLCYSCSIGGAVWEVEYVCFNLNV